MQFLELGILCKIICTFKTKIMIFKISKFLVQSYSANRQCQPYSKIYCTLVK